MTEEPKVVVRDLVPVKVRDLRNGDMFVIDADDFKEAVVYMACGVVNDTFAVCYCLTHPEEDIHQNVHADNDAWRVRITSIEVERLL